MISIDSPSFPEKMCNFFISHAVKILSIGTDRSEQTVQAQIRLVLKEQSDQGLQYFPFHLHFFGCITALKIFSAITVANFQLLIGVTKTGTLRHLHTIHAQPVRQQNWPYGSLFSV